jgi:CSLREA domain-containing protein
LTASLLLAIADAGAATYTVTRFDDPAPGTCLVNDCSLREAVNAANARAGADRIVLGEGTHQLSRSDTTPDEFGSSANALLVSESVEITGISRGKTRVRWSALAGRTADRIFAVNRNDMSVRLSLAQLTVSNGIGSQGGCFYMLSNNGSYRHTLALRAAAVEYCNAEFGGAGLFRNTDLYLDSSYLRHNSASLDGGALYLAGTNVVDALGSFIESNEADRDGGAVAIFGNGMVGLHSDVIWRDNGTGAIRYNHAVDNGGAFHVYGTATLDLASDSTLSGQLLTLRGNSADGTGGAIHLHTNMTVTPSRFARLRFVDNFAQAGGALHSGYRHNVSDSEFSGNWAATHGGAIFLSAVGAGTRDYQRVSFNDNRADSGSGGGIYSECVDFSASDVSFHANSAASGRGQAIDALGNVTLRHVSAAGHGAEPALRKRYSTACTGRSLRYGNSLIDGACASTLAGELVSDGGNQLGLGAGACPALRVDQRQSQANAFGLSYANFGGDIPVLGWASDGQFRPQRDFGLASLCTASDGRGQPRSDGLCDAGAFEQ